METSEASANAMAEQAPVTAASVQETTPMDTDVNDSNNPETAGEASAPLEQPMDTENDNEGQQNDNLSAAGGVSNLDSVNRLQQANDSSSASSGNIPQSEQFDAANENLATLAAVSAAGAEVKPIATAAAPPTAQTIDPPPPPQTTANPAAAEESSKSTSAINTPAPTHQPSTQSTIATTAAAPPPTNPPIDEEDAKWHTVGIFPGLSTTVTSYIDNSVWSSSGLNLNADDLPDLTQHARINLEPGTAYRFRIRALNSVGSSDWSEISSFKTCLPGFPGAPSAIKISKSSEGAHLTWEPPPSCVSSNEIVEYSVYLAVKPGKEKETKAGQRAPAQLAFVRVYVGAANQCTVSHTSLSAAHVDCSNKPAIIFRIAARNEKGYGPATQVRWLQDPVQNSAANTGMGGPNSLLSPTRVKPEMTGASPNKRFKATAGGR